MLRDLKKILYVEDDPNIQAIAQITLINIGNFDLCCCYSGKEALEKIDEFQPDLILSDVMMPEIDGPTMLKIIRSNPKYNNIPVVFISARVQEQEVQEYMEIGVADVISKPFDPLSLSTVLKRVWAKTNAE